MARNRNETQGASCCRISIPAIPRKWLLFIDFAFTLGTSLVYLADIITDAFTLKAYWDREWYYAFGFSMGFIIVPSILLAVLECQFLIKTYGKNTKWSTVLVRTLLNIPFQLTVIWYHFKLSLRYWRIWRLEVNEKGVQPITTEDRKMSMSNLADLDERANTIERRAIASKEVPVADISIPAAAYDGAADHTWWKQLTREEWLSHLNKMKLTESMLESLPQLLINLYLIVKYPGTPVIQYLSATLSYLSLCGGIVRYDKTRKDNEADRLMVDRTLLHSRAFATRLEWPQILFLSLYKGCFLAARILVFVYFTVYFQVYVLVFIFIHWAVLMAYLVYLWYPTDLHKKTRQLVQADYKFRAYMFLSQDFLSVFHNSLVGIFISVRPKNYAFLGQPYCYLFWFYFAYIIENIVLFMFPGVYFSIRDQEILLMQYQYYIVLIFELALNVFGAMLCLIYYFSIHKMSIYTRNAYPQFSKLQSTGLCCCCDLTQPAPKQWTVCKQAETSEIFYLRREKLKEYKSGYTTVVRVNRQKGRNLECFIDERGKIFYAPRNKLFKKVPSLEEEELVCMRKDPSRQSLDDLGRDSSSRRPESLSTFQNERLVGEELSIGKDEEESTPLILSPPAPPPLPNTPPRASTPDGKSSAHASIKSDQTAVKNLPPASISPHLTKDISPADSQRLSTRSSQRQNPKPRQEQDPSKSQHDISSRSSRSPSAKGSERSHKKGEIQSSAKKEKNESREPPPHSSNRSPPRSPRSAHPECGTGSPRNEPERFSPENMWKAHDEKYHDLPHGSKSPVTKSVKKSCDRKSQERESNDKSDRSPEKQEPSDLASNEHSHESHSSQSGSHRSNRSPSKRRSNRKSRHHDSADDGESSSRKSNSRGGPVGQTWI